MEFLSEYGMFLAKGVTFVILTLIVVIVFAATSKVRSKNGEIHATVLNDEFDSFTRELREATMSKNEIKKHKKELDKSEKEKDESESTKKSGVYVLDFNGDVMATGVESLRNEITAIIGVAKEGEEVVLRLESPGGAAHSYGLAASQLDRIKSAGLKLTICVDRVAASGGYMMACVANKIIAAPFAVLGSIGVVAEFPNFNRALKNFGVDYETFTAGDLKRTVTIMGENTDEGKAEFKKQLSETHDLFKSFVKEQRPVVEIDEIATGKTWYGTKALENNLIDAISTSDQYLIEKAKESSVIHVAYKAKPKALKERIGIAAGHAVKSAIMELIQQNSNIKNIF